MAATALMPALGTPAPLANSHIDQCISLHASACNALQRALRELRGADTDYHHAAIQTRAAMDAITTLRMIGVMQGEVVV